MIQKIRLWIPLAVTITLVCGLIYGVVQQNYRQNANDPQIQIADDVAQAIERGESYASFVYPSNVNLVTSLAPFVIVYDSSKNIKFTNADLDSRTPKPPEGVFDYAQSHAENRITWEPERGIRIAIVVTSYTDNGGGYVLVGRSLREVERRVQQLTTDIAIGWFVSMAISFACVLMLVPKKR
jgi:hypothetical protein